MSDGVKIFPFDSFIIFFTVFNIITVIQSGEL